MQYFFLKGQGQGTLPGLIRVVWFLRFPGSLVNRSSFPYTSKEDVSLVFLFFFFKQLTEIAIVCVCKREKEKDGRERRKFYLLSRVRIMGQGLTD